MNKETGSIFGRLAADLDSAGAPHKHRVHDVWIAALALQHNMRVLTQNEKDFRGIPGGPAAELKRLRKPRPAFDLLSGWHPLPLEDSATWARVRAKTARIWRGPFPRV